MRKLSPSDREILDEYFERQGWNTFYHYFPLIYALSEGAVEMKFDEDAGALWVGENELYFPHWNKERFGFPELARKVWIGPYPCPSWMGRSELYDVNYVYSLTTTISIKNFRKNARRFERTYPTVEYAEAKRPEECWEVVKRWYRRSAQETFGDFGYTEWLAWNYDVFPDLRARVVRVEGSPVAFSLWGELREDLAIHLVCKDLGWSYLQDYTRFQTYSEMLEEGYDAVNDGSDCGREGLRIYKLKLRPRFIIPIYSWVRWEAS